MITVSKCISLKIGFVSKTTHFEFIIKTLYSAKKKKKLSLLLTLLLSSLSGHAREAVKETDSSYNGMERASAAQRLPKTDSFQPKPVGPSSDYRPHSEQPAAQRPEMNTPPQFASSKLSASASPAAVSTSLNKDSTRPRVSATAVSESPTSPPRPPVVSSPDIESALPQTSTPPNVSSAPSPAAPPRLSSPPRMMQGFRREMSPVGSKHLSVGASCSSLPASPPKLSTPLSSTDGLSRPISSVPPVLSPSFESHPTKSSLPPTTLSPPALVSTSSYSASAAISSLQQMVQGSRTPLVTSGAQHEKPGPPKLMSDFLSVGAKSSSAGVAPPLMSSTSAPTGSCLSTSASPMSVSTSPSVGGKPHDPAPATQHQMYTPLAANSGLSAASAASLLPGAASPPSPAAHESPTVRPLSTLPLLTTQASRTAPVSAPPALVSVPPAMGTSSGVVQSSDSEHYSPNTTPSQALKQASPKPEHHGHSEDRKAKERNGKPEEHFPQLDSGTRRTPQKVEATETNESEILSDLPYKPLQTTVAPDQSKSKNKQTDSEKRQSGVLCESEEQAPLRKSSHLHSTKVEDLTDEDIFDDSSLFDTPSRIKASSFMDKSSLADDESSRVDDSRHHDSSFPLRKDTSFAEGDTSTAFDTTKDSSFSVEDSRDETLDSTREGETSEAEETKDGSQITGKSMLESSLNNTSQMDDPSDVSDSRLYVPSQPGRQGKSLKFTIMGTNIT